MAGKADPYFQVALREELARRQQTNPAYSLRAFAKQLGVLPPTLSAVLNGKRSIPPGVAEEMSERLSFTPAEKKRFLTSVYLRKAPPSAKPAFTSNARILRDELHYQIIAEWEHYAILTLAETRGFQAKKSWIAKRLGISEARAQTSLDKLVQAELMSIDSAGRLRLNQSHVHTHSTAEEIRSAALRQSHRENLTMGLEKLDNVPLDQRDYSSMTIAVAPQRLREAKKLIREFQKQLSELLEDGTRTDVYQLCMQLYPLTMLPEERLKGVGK